MIKKAVIILGAGPEQLDSYKIAKRRNLVTYSVDKNINAPGHKLSNYQIVESIYNYKKILKKKLVKKIQNLIGIIAVGVDVPNTVFRLSEYFKLKTINKNLIKKVNGKLNLYDFFYKENIIPLFKKIKNLNNVNSFTKKNNFPIILKPDFGRGSREVFLLKNQRELRKFFKNQGKLINSKTFIVQKFISGKQYSIECLFKNGKFLSLISSRDYNTYKNFHPYIIENGGDFDPSMTKKMQNNILLFCKKIANKLKILNGPLKFDLIVHKNKIYLIEVAVRFGGGFVAAKCSKLLIGKNFLELYFDNLLNVKNNFEKVKKFKKNYVSTRAIVSKREGILKEIKILIPDKLKRNLVHISYNKKIGDKVCTPKSHAERVGFIIVKTNKKNLSSKVANKILKNIKLYV